MHGRRHRPARRPQLPAVPWVCNRRGGRPVSERVAGLVYVAPRALEAGFHVAEEHRC